eukprot:gene3772-1290_t
MQRTLCWQRPNQADGPWIEQRPVFQLATGRDGDVLLRDGHKWSVRASGGQLLWVAADITESDANCVWRVPQGELTGRCQGVVRKRYSAEYAIAIWGSVMEPVLSARKAIILGNCDET